MRLGIDTGGTFTDAVLYDNAEGVVRSAKSLTTHHDLSIGIRNVIDRIESDQFSLQNVVEFTSISTTLATNAIVEGRGGTICLLLIGHSPESLNRSNLKTALRGDPVEFIDGGHTASGSESMPLDVESAKTLILKHASSVTAFAVAGMFSVRNSSHEIAVRDLVLKLTNKPVTCTVELTSRLDAPRRAMTAVLNARLISPITQLIQSVQSELQTRGITSRLMVVNGDGSMMSAELATTRPVETILSGPAASIIGACALAEKTIKVVADIGGTTTDIAILGNGKPSTAREGAHVGEFKTFVKAVEVHTIGLGGDSQVSFERPLKLGPVRALPLSCLAYQHPQIVEVLRKQLEHKPREFQGCFALRRRSTDDLRRLNRSDHKLWKHLETGPVNCEDLFREPRMLYAFNRLKRLDLVHLSAFTPTDALHVLGLMQRWNKESAELAAQLWVRGFAERHKPPWHSCEEFCHRVIDKVIESSCEIIVRAAIAHENPDASLEEIGQLLLRKGVSAHQSKIINVAFSLNGTLAVVGAPAPPIYPQVAERLNSSLCIPKHAEVGNAVGAAAGNISQTVSGLITSPADGIYRTHTPLGVRDFQNLDESANFAISELQQIATQRTTLAAANASAPIVKRNDILVTGVGGHKIFVESRIEVTMAGEVNLT